MKVREIMGSSVRTMVKVTTDGDQHQDIVNVASEISGRAGAGGRVCDGEGLRDRVFTTCAVMVYR